MGFPSPSAPKAPPPPPTPPTIANPEVQAGGAEAQQAAAAAAGQGFAGTLTGSALGANTPNTGKTTLGG